MTGPRHIALVGMPGAGKTTVGRVLAERLGLPFADSDEEVAAAADASVSDIWARDGEAAFRAREEQAIARLLAGPPAVIATGGGAFAQPATRAALQAGATTVWLHADLSTLSRRTAGGGRPLLAGDRDAALRALWAERRPAYARAALRVGAGPEPGAVADAILAALPAAPAIVPVGGEKPYDVLIGPGLLPDAGWHLQSVLRGRAVALVADHMVDSLHGDRVAAALEGLAVHRLAIAPGEASKSWDGLRDLVERLAAAGLDRSGAVLALGGGVVGDLAGLAAALHLRGVDWIGAPTTLLSIVDSSVGGKTAIDTAAGKNMAGAFWPPRLVLADLDTLATLPPRELAAGYAEVVKMALLGDAPFLGWLEAHGPAVLRRDPDALRFAVERSVRAKAAIVTADEREAGPRALLNLGHSFGHALEAETGFGPELLHGEAVALGCVLALRFSARLGLCPAEDAVRAARVLSAAGLPTALSDLSRRHDPARLVARMAADKKNKDGALTLILARGVGDAFVAPGIAPDDVEVFLRSAPA